VQREERREKRRLGLEELGLGFIKPAIVLIRLSSISSSCSSTHPPRSSLVLLLVVVGCCYWLLLLLTLAIDYWLRYCSVLCLCRRSRIADRLYPVSHCSLREGFATTPSWRVNEVTRLTIRRIVVRLPTKSTRFVVPWYLLDCDTRMWQR
jgi:hypothetical protein